MQFVFIVCQVEGYRNLMKLSCRTLAFTSYEAFLKIKRSLELAPYLILCMIFKEKNFSGYILLPEQILLLGYFYFMGSWIVCVLQMFVNQVVTS